MSENRVPACPNNVPRGIVFDLDGTIVDNMPIHAEAFAIFADRHGLPPLTLDDRRRLDGKRNRDIFPVLFGRPLAGEELRAFSWEKEALYRDLSRGRLTALRGFIRLLDLAEARRVPVAIATSAPAENVAHTLAELGLAGRLTRVARSDQLPRGKPHPDVFIAAAALLEVRPDDCLAFEDSPSGIVAAHAAGMATVAVTTTFSRETFLANDPPPDVIVADFEEFLDGHARWQT